ncbi:hypothetical protein GQ55_1G156900 [Panicum hallii var. hallii]|uniref:Uncharacterized protein n=1 Tax=Panicum hallii var. hallii TaxID=1504633 RepID=A0A2T7F5I6_9POAL|nr:hypothetical protein GQ55_1G156900 [Panicum hallii var. hallii]
MQCMRNNARLRELGIFYLCNELAEANKISHKKKNNPSSRNSKDSEFEYEPSEDDTNDDNAKGSKECNIRTANKTLGAIQLRSMRVFAEQEVTRNTRSKKTIVQSAATLAPSLDIDDHTQATIEG